MFYIVIWLCNYMHPYQRRKLWRRGWNE